VPEDQAQPVLVEIIRSGFVNGAAYVDLSGIAVADAGTDVQVSGSQHIGISGMQLISSSTSSNGVALNQSSDSQVSTSYFQGPFPGSAGVNVYGGGAGDDVITTNVFTGQHSNAVIDTAVPDVAITSNTVVGLCGNGISVNPGDAGYATGTTIEDNILAEFACGGTTGILTDSQDAPTLNYNIVYPDQASTLDYYWTSGETATSYTSSAAFCTATGDGCDDLNTNPDIDADETLDAGQLESGTSLLNFAAGQTVSNSVIVPVAADGKIDLAVSGVNSSVRADLIADVTGYLTGTTASGTASITLPNGTGVADYTLPTDAAAWDFNLTAVQGTANGLIAAYPVVSASTPVPAVSNLNYGLGQTVANFAQVTGGTADPWQSSVSFTNSRAHGTVQLICDLYGFYGTN